MALLMVLLILIVIIILGIGIILYIARDLFKSESKLNSKDSIQ